MNTIIKAPRQGAGGGGMKVKSVGLFMWVGIAVMILGLGVAPVQASQYLGEVTWNGIDDEAHTFTVKGGISRVGGSYYEIQGQVLNTPEGLGIFSGGGVLVGDNVIFAVTLTLETKSILIMQVTINKTTNNGTFWVRDAYLYLPHGDERLNSWSDPFPESYIPNYTLKSSLWGLGSPPTTGTLTVSSNPIPLAASIAGQLPLLLQ
jgi:hypothetical protein